jgi:hypothetical protein
METEKALPEIHVKPVLENSLLMQRVLSPMRGRKFHLAVSYIKITTSFRKTRNIVREEKNSPKIPFLSVGQQPTKVLV